ncbi:unnamed protein product [Trifolium pratense]|uniref:Uncharacterized protein n=1 Tax=Trifolium pratense TaxID=57577 RepID=A0ACB0JM86_TRIPR|nr:unnamed protein product [Trifolium pratense]
MLCVLLLYCWIHEYFPTLGRRAESGLDCDIPGASLPRARRWRYRQGNVKLPAYRPVLDALTPDDVIWRPFQNHRAALPFDLVSMYSGYLCGCTVVRYLPERCIRRFGYVQYIPPPPPPAPAIDVIDSDRIGYDIAVDRIVQPTRPATYAAEAAADYLSWYYTVSHPIIFSKNLASSIQFHIIMYMTTLGANSNIIIKTDLRFHRTKTTTRFQCLPSTVAVFKLLSLSTVTKPTRLHFNGCSI